MKATLGMAVKTMSVTRKKSLESLRNMVAVRLDWSKLG